MKFCSNCGSGQLEFTIPEGDNHKRFICRNCSVIHYSNPNIVTGCLPVWEDKVLLAKRAIEPRMGYWNIPGGFLENGETVKEGAAREVREEANAEVIIKNMVSLYDIPHINQVYIHFWGELINGEYSIGPESTEVALFTENEIPWKEIAFTSSTFTLKRFFEDRNEGPYSVHFGKFDLERWEKRKGKS